MDIERWHEVYIKAKPPKKDPCRSCQSKDHCNAICVARAKWWDVAMEKIRRRLGV